MENVSESMTLPTDDKSEYRNECSAGLKMIALLLSRRGGKLENIFHSVASKINLRQKVRHR